MIKEINIKNFQSHDNTNLILDSGVNVIVGSSDSGKSAIIRALRWVTSCVPRGDAIRSYWSEKDDTKVSIITDNNEVVERIRNNMANKYILTKDDSSEIVFEAFNNVVPEEIQDVLNIEDSINIQNQIDPPYLISQTSGSVALHFNKIANLEKVDLGLKTTKTMLNSTEAKIKLKTEERQKTKEELNTFKYLKGAEVDLKKLEEADRQKTQKTNKKTNISNTLLVATQIQQSIKEISTILDAEKPLKNILGISTKKDNLKKKIGKLNNQLDLIKEINKKHSNHLKVTKADTQVKKLIELHKSLRKARVNYKQLNVYIINFNSISEQLVKFEKITKADLDIAQLISDRKNITQGKTKYNNINKKIKEIKLTKKDIEINLSILRKLEIELKQNMPPVCPLCNSKLK